MGVKNQVIILVSENILYVN